MSERSNGSPVSVREMALRREKRAEQQRELLALHPDCCVVCLNLNIAGPVKRSGLTDHAFFTAATRIVNALAGAGMTFADAALIEENTGAEALFAVRG